MNHYMTVYQHTVQQHYRIPAVTAALRWDADVHVLNTPHASRECLAGHIIGGADMVQGRMILDRTINGGRCIGCRFKQQSSYVYGCAHQVPDAQVASAKYPPRHHDWVKWCSLVCPPPQRRHRG
jgi:hypothetical protein